jgi:hypothetical protein
MEVFLLDISNSASLHTPFFRSQLQHAHATTELMRQLKLAVAKCKKKKLKQTAGSYLQPGYEAAARHVTRGLQSWKPLG